MSPTMILVRSQRTARWVVSLIALLFVMACGLPAITIWQELPPRTGLWCLVLGIAGCFAWFPNPLLLYGSVALLRGRNRTGLVAGLLACVCSQPFIFYMLVGGGFSRMHVGYFLWQADIFVFSLAALGMTIHFGENPGRIEPPATESGVSELDSSGKAATESPQATWTR